MRDKKYYDRQYLKEYGKGRALSDLDNAKQQIVMISNVVNLGFDSATKLEILQLVEHIREVLEREQAKALKKQKRLGKKFVSDKEIDEIVDKIQKEFQ